MAQRYHMDVDFPGWPRRPTLEAAAALYFLACVGRVALNLAGYLVALAFPGLDGQGVNWGLNLLYQAGFLLLPVARYCQERPGMGTGLRLRRCPPLALFLCALAAVAALFLADSLGTLWLVLLEVLGARLSLAAPAMDNGLMALLLSALLPAVCEELMFRGMILSAWERRGSRRALVMSGLLFACLHGSVEGFPVHLALGLALGALVLGSGSLYAGMLFHLLYNGLSLVLSGGGQTGQTLLAQIGGLQGVWTLLARTGLYGMVLCGLTWGVWAVGDSENAPPQPRQAMPLSAIVVLAGGLVTTLCVYLIDLLSLWGVL